MEPLKGPSGKQLAYGTKDKFLVQNQFCVTSACKLPEIVARWVDYMYDPIITLQSNHAPISVGGWRLREDGKYEKGIPEGFTTIGEYFVDNHFQQVPRLSIGKAADLAWENPDDYVPFKFARGSMQKHLHDDIRGPYIIDRMPNVKPLPEENETLSLISPVSLYSFEALITLIKISLCSALTLLIFF
jgi:putative aldouronate transport system substrate-binding protein